MSTRPVGAKRLGLLPPYLFAEIERKIAAKRAEGVDIISLGIGDPDTPTPELVVRRMADAVSDPGTHQYPSNRGRESFRTSVAGFYDRRFGVSLDPDSEILPALGAKEAIANLNLALLDPGDVALASDPGYPVYTMGPLLVASFAYNFNNFVVIDLFNKGGPPISGTISPVGHTDILVTYTYRIAFSSGRGADLGYAAAITVAIFLILVVITYFQFRYTNMLEERSENV